GRGSMKVLFFSFFIALLAQVANADIDSCHYTKGRFVVIQDGVRQTQNVDDDFAWGLARCSLKLAALYDGDDLFVFNDDTSRFERHFADDGFDGHSLRVTRHVVGFYDGDDFLIFDRAKNSFTRHFADDLFEFSSMRGFRGGMGFYDGDDFIVYERENGGFTRHFADDLFETSDMARFPNGLLFYDGDDIISFCDGSFSRTFADDGETAFSGFQSLQVGDEIYRLTEDCDIERL
ncbi:MAG: hypothetical protein AAF203_05685, partial [Pseudomonadota bacterium]